jgi:hypothetical protein
MLACFLNYRVIDDSSQEGLLKKQQKVLFNHCQYSNNESMSAIFHNRKINDDDRRMSLYEGDIFVYSPTSETRGFIAFARALIQDAFDGRDPVIAQYDMPVEKYVAILKELKPRFINHPRSKEFLSSILQEKGCDPELTYFDVPRMRSSTSDDYLTSGIAYAFHPHRDTWYSAPMSQINWWLPIYDVEQGNVMAFHPRYFDVPIKNGSREYNYQKWKATSRKEAAKHIKKDTRKQPEPEEPIELNPQTRIVTKPGGMIIFSAGHLHSSIPNYTGKTRFSIDFRTVHLNDLKELKGAPNLDSACTGTTMGDYLRVSDLEGLPESIIDRYMAGHPQELVSV